MPDEIKWSAPEFATRPKNISWYWLTIIIAIVILGLAVWQKNFLFGFFIVLAEVLFLIWGNKEPAMVNFSLSSRGLDVGESKQYPLSDLQGWSAIGDTERDWQDLFLHFKSRVKPPLKIKIPKDKSAEIKRVAGEFLPEVDHQPSLLDALEELIRF